MIIIAAMDVRERSNLKRSLSLLEKMNIRQGSEILRKSAKEVL